MTELNPKELEIKKYWSKEWAFYKETEEYINKATDLPDEALDKLKSLNSMFYSQLRKSFKIAKTNDSSQAKLTKSLLKLRNSEEEIKAILNNAIVGIVRIDNEGRVIFVNEGFSVNYGYSADEVVGKFWSSFILEKDVIEIRPQIHDFMENGSTILFDSIRMANKEGRYIWVSASLAKIYDNNGNFDSFVLVAVDINKRKLATEELEESYIKLKKAQKEIVELERKNSAFAVAVTTSHEINQPLMILKANLDMLEMSFEGHTLTKKQLKYMRRLDESAERIKKIVAVYKHANELEFEDYVNGTEMAIFDNNKEKTDDS